MRFIRWSGRDECPDCKEIAMKTDIPPLQRMKLLNKADCPIHGHPAYSLSVESKAWIDFWNWIAPYADTYTIPFDLIDKVCRETGIQFLDAFDKLSEIHKVLRGKDNRHKDINQEDESTI